MAVGKGEIRTRITMTPNARVVERAFREAGVEFGDYRPAWPEAAGAMRQAIVRGIQSRGGSLGKPWPRGNPQYLRAKLRKGLGGRTLVRKGRLLTQAMTGKPLSMRPKSVSVGFGPGARWAHVPKLQFTDGYSFVGWDGQARAGVQAALDHYVQEIFGRVRMKLQRSAA